MSVLAASKTIQYIDERLRHDLDANAAATSSDRIAVQDSDDLPIGQVRVGDDWASSVCDAGRLLAAIRRLPNDAPLGTEDAETGSIWAAIRSAETKR